MTLIDLAPQTKILFTGAGDAWKNATLPKLFYLAGSTAEAGFETHIVVRDSPENRRLQEESHHGVEAHWFSSTERRTEIATKHDAIRRIRPDIAQVVGIGFRDTTIFGRPLSSPFLIHDYDEWMASLDGLSALERAAYKMVEGYTRRRAHGIVVASRALRALVSRIRPDLGELILHLPIGFDPTIQPPAARVVRGLRKRLGGRTALVYVGTLVPRYDHRELIRLGQRLRESDANAVIVIVGGGPDLVPFGEEIERLGLGETIWLEGWVARHEVGSYLAVADVLLFPFPPSVQNIHRCPTKAFQYAAANKPIVTNAVGEVAELLGDAGFYYPPKDPDGLFDSTRRAMNAAPSYDRPDVAMGTTWRERGDKYVHWLRNVVTPRL